MNPSLIAKIQKLRALAAGAANLHEAAAAAEAAERLIQEHRLTEAELETPDAEVTIVTEDLDTRSGHPEGWRANLVCSLAAHHGCSQYFMRVRQRIRLKRRRSRMQTKQIIYRVVGRPDDVATVRYLYAWLTAEIERLTAASPHKGRTARNSFRLGASIGFDGALAQARQTLHAEATPTQSAALVRLNQRAAEAAAHLPALGLPKKPHDPTLDPSAFVSGIRTGRAIHIGERVGEGGVIQRLGTGKDKA